MSPTIVKENVISNAMPEPESDRNLGEPQLPHYGLCGNERCRKGPNRTRGGLKSPRAKYCCRYCRVDVYRRNRPKPEEFEKPTRKRRSDAKYGSHAERQRAYYDRHRDYQLPQAIKDYLEAQRAGSDR